MSGVSKPTESPLRQMARAARKATMLAEDPINDINISGVASANGTDDAARTLDRLNADIKRLLKEFDAAAAETTITG